MIKEQSSIATFLTRHANRHFIGCILPYICKLGMPRQCFSYGDVVRVVQGIPRRGINPSNVVLRVFGAVVMANSTGHDVQNISGWTCDQLLVWPIKYFFDRPGVYALNDKSDVVFSVVQDFSLSGPLSICRSAVKHELHIRELHEFFVGGQELKRTSYTRLTLLRISR